MKTFIHNIGIDVSKSSLDVCILPKKTFKSFSNDESGLKKLINLIGKLESPFVVFEPTGGYEKLLQHKLLSNKIACAKVNAKQIRDYARCTGRIAKTDSIDSYVLAEYGQKIQPRKMVCRSPEQDHLCMFIKRRKQLTVDLVREKNRLEKTADRFVQRSIKRHISVLEKEIVSFEEEIVSFITSNELLKRIYDVLTSVKGVGSVTAAVIIGELPELGKVNHKAIASIAGLAPHNRDSGTMRGKRTIFGGRAGVRCALYMAILTAVKWDESTKKFYERLKGAGKPPKLALTAAMRKLLTRLNAKVRDEIYSKA